MEFLEKFKVADYNGQPVSFIQQKFDGYYVEVYKSKQFGIVVCMKKQNIDLWPKLKKHPEIAHQLRSLPYDTILRCELHSPGIPATSVPTLINDADYRLLLSPFKVEMIRRTYFDTTTDINSKLAEAEGIRDLGFTVPRSHILFQCPESLNDKEVNHWLESAKGCGYEGWVLCNHQENKYYKLKPQKTVDAFIVGYEISDSDSFFGGLKSVQIAVYDGTEEKVIASVSSFTEEFKMSTKLESLIGKVAEFKYQRVGARGRLIFARFLRWRDDEKTKRQCKIEQLK